MTTTARPAAHPSAPIPERPAGLLIVGPWPLRGPRPRPARAKRRAPRFRQLRLALPVAAA